MIKSSQEKFISSVCKKKAQEGEGVKDLYNKSISSLFLPHNVKKQLKLNKIEDKKRYDKYSAMLCI